MQLLPLQPGASYQFTTELSDVPVVVAVRWNATAGCYVIKLYDYDGNALIDSFAARLGICAFQAKAAGYPDGMFWVVDTSASGVEAAYDDLGNRVKVYWSPASETPPATASALNSEPVFVSGPEGLLV